MCEYGKDVSVKCCCSYHRISWLNSVQYKFRPTSTYFLRIRLYICLQFSGGIAFTSLMRIVISCWSVGRWSFAMTSWKKNRGFEALLIDDTNIYSLPLVLLQLYYKAHLCIRLLISPTIGKVMIMMTWLLYLKYNVLIITFVTAGKLGKYQ